MDVQDNAHSESPQPRHDTPEVMLKRIFAVAEILAKAKTSDRNNHQKERTRAEKTQDEETVVS